MVIPMLLYAFLITFLAGMTTVLGGLIVLLVKKNENIIINSLSFAAGVMITVSLFDLIPESLTSFKQDYQSFPAILFLLIFINIGIIISLFIDKTVSIKENKIYRVGIISMLAMILHNIPEGMATFITTDQNFHLGLVLSASIAAHNIPEGIIIAFPIFYAIGSKKTAILYTFIAGMSELLGGFISFVFLRPFINDFIMGALYAIIAGIMLCISFHELLPTAFAYFKRKRVYIFLLLGITIMLSSHLLFH